MRETARPERLRVERVGKRFGGLAALHDVSFETDTALGGEVLGLIGPNGAGKTTLFNIISGFLKPSEGQVYYGEHLIARHRPHEVVELGIARTFQIVKPFSELTVLDNVLTGCGQPVYPQARAFVQRSHTPQSLDAAHAILELTDLERWARALAGSLPIGLQRRLEIARALATGPTLMLLDEPAAGLTAGEATELAALIRTIHEGGPGIITIEHNMAFAMGLCERLIVLDHGELIAAGTPAEVRAEPRVVNAYLGRE